MKSTLIVLLCTLGLSLSAQQVTTFYSSPTNQIDDAIIQDKYGNVYGSHFTGLRIYKISPTGVLSIFASGLNSPNGLAINSKGELYAADNIGNRIYHFDSTGAGIDTIFINSPSGIIKELDSDTMIFTQYSRNTLRKLAPDGSVSAPFIGGQPLRGPVGLCYGTDSLLYIGNFDDRKIFKIDSGRVIFVAQIPGNVNTNLGYITQAKGFVYGTAFQTNKIYKVDPNYLDSVVLYAGSSAGNTNGSLAMARFNGPNGIYASRGGDSLLISDFISGDIRLISGGITDLKLVKTQDIKLNYYPNPANSQLTIEVETPELNLRVCDLQARKIYLRKRLKRGTNYLTLETLSKGIYLLEFQSNWSTKIEKLIIE